MAGKKLKEVDGANIPISFSQKSGNIEKISRPKITVLEKELEKTHLTYDDRIALTDNYIISMNALKSSIKIIDSIKYDDMVWIYTGMTGGVETTNVMRVLSFVKGVDEKSAKKAALITMGTDLALGVVNALMVGIPAVDNKNIMIIFSKDREAIAIEDANPRTFGSKSSKEFQELLDTIVDRGPNNLMVGREYEDDFCDMMGIDTYKTPSDSSESADEYSEGDGGDDLL